MKISRRLTLIAMAAVGLVAAGCSTPPPTAATLAVAYSNLDGVQGYDSSGPDVLIARVIDSNGDGTVSAGDTMTTDQYPLNNQATAFGRFLARSHVVTGGALNAPGQVRVESGEYRFFFTDSGHFSGSEAMESYSEFDAGANAGSTVLMQDIVPPGFGFDIVSVNVLAEPSQPDTEPTGDGPPESFDDDVFLDVDIFV